MTNQLSNNQTETNGKRKPDFRLVQKYAYTRFENATGRAHRHFKYIELAAGWNEVDSEGKPYISWSSNGTVPHPDIDGEIKYMQFPINKENETNA